MRRLVGLVCVLVLLTGCASIPRDGPVVAGDPAQRAGRVQALVPPPVPGAEPDAIARGFLRAGLSPGAGHSAGRAYMTPGGAAHWRPARETLVHTGQLDVVLAQAGDRDQDTVTARVSVTVRYRVDGAGRLTTPAEQDTHEFDLVLTRSTGQWRVQQAPDLTVLPETDFPFVYDAHTLYFLDPTSTFFVPEPRWLPVADDTPSRLVDLLLGGPPPWLGQAAVTAFPPDTRRLASVEVGRGTDRVDVDLSAAVGEVGEDQRGLMRAQLLATLQQVSGTGDVRLLADGRPVQAPEVSVRALPDHADSPVVLRQGTLARFHDDRLVTVVGLPALQGQQVSDPAVDYAGRRYAVLTENRTRLQVLTVGRDRAAEAVTGARLTVPSFDWRGWVWTAASDGTVHVFSPEGVRTQVAAPWLADLTPLALRISPDGSRAAVLTNDARGARIDLVAVQRAADGTPLALTHSEQSRVEPDLLSASDLTWAGGLDLVVLGRRRGQAQDGPIRVQLGGPHREPLGRVPGGQRVTAASTLRSTIVSTGQGTNLVQAGAGWVVLAELSGTQDPAYPG